MRSEFHRRPGASSPRLIRVFLLLLRCLASILALSLSLSRLIHQFVFSDVSSLSPCVVSPYSCGLFILWCLEPFLVVSFDFSSSFYAFPNLTFSFSFVLRLFRSYFVFLWRFVYYYSIISVWSRCLGFLLQSCASDV